MRGSMFATRKVIRAKQPPNSFGRPGNPNNNSDRPLTATKLKLCSRGERGGHSREKKPSADKSVQDSFSLGKAKECLTTRQSALACGDPASNISVGAPQKRGEVKTILVAPVVRIEETLSGEELSYVDPKNEMKMVQSHTASPPSDVHSIAVNPSTRKSDAPPPATVQPQRHSEDPIISSFGRLSFGGVQKDPSCFRDFMRKMCTAESHEYETARPRTNRKLLKSISSAVDLHHTSMSRYQTTPWNLAKSKLEPETKQQAGISEEGEKEEDITTAGYAHGMYKPAPLLSSEVLMRRIQAKCVYSEKIRETLGEGDRELFDLIEQHRMDLLKHGEWFAGPEAQKRVYLMVTDIENKWLQPSEAIYLQLLSEEKRRVEQELKQKTIADDSKSKELECKIDTTIFERIIEKEHVMRKQTANAFDEAKKGVQNSKLRLKQHDEKLADSCASHVWNQYKEHKSLFDIIAKKMRGHPHYCRMYKEALKQLDQAARDSVIINPAELVLQRYKEMWEIICDFFTSKEYLATYNPVFLHTRRNKERDDVLGQLFEIRALDIEMEFYEIIIHLMYKQLLTEKFENLRRLQLIVRIQKKWKEFRRDPLVFAPLSPPCSQRVSELLP